MPRPMPRFAPVTALVKRISKVIFLGWLLTGDYLGGEGDVCLGCGLRHD